jgi:hypothetical protein
MVKYLVDLKNIESLDHVHVLTLPLVFYGIDVKQTVINFITKWDKDQFVCNLFHLISDYNLRTLQFCIFNRSSKNNICVFQVSLVFGTS